MRLTPDGAELQVKCHGGRPCMACARLGLDCFDGSPSSPSACRRPSSAADEPTTARKKRTFRSCISCRASKTKCDGDRPSCRRCQTRSVPCTYDAGPDPAWTSQLMPKEPPPQLPQPEPVSPVASSTRVLVTDTHLPARQERIAPISPMQRNEVQPRDADAHQPELPTQPGDNPPAAAELQLVRTISNPLQW